MNKVRKKLIREKAVIAIYQHLLVNNTQQEIEEYLRAYYAPRMDENEIELCKIIIFDVIENIEQYQSTISDHLKKGWTLDRISLMNQAILLVSLNDMKENPKEIVINEAVELSKKYGDETDYKFIHGVLSQIG